MYTFYCISCLKHKIKIVLNNKICRAPHDEHIHESQSANIYIYIYIHKYYDKSPNIKNVMYSLIEKITKLEIQNNQKQNINAYIFIYI